MVRKAYVVNLLKEEMSICFDDILLVPQQSDIVSRKLVNLTMHGYSFPIVSSPMDTVTGWEMAAHIADVGGIGIIHRYMDNAERLWQLQMALSATKNPDNVGIGISAQESMESSFINDLMTLDCKWVCIDTANGHGDSCALAVRSLKSRYPELKVMAGNVATASGYAKLAKMGADAVRVGIGGGATCTTRLVSGHGVPTLQSIIDCYNFKKENNIKTLIVADGGIKTTGDIVKSFAAGADLVMLGSMLAGTEETPGDVVNGFKSFRGMASVEAQLDWRGEVSVAEGIDTLIPYKGLVKDVINKIIGGIGSGCSYSGVHNLEDLSKEALYTLVSSNSVKESIPHGQR
jgi:IMP dehydrogenase